MIAELLEAVTQHLRDQGVASGRVYYGEPDPDRISAEAPLVFVRLHGGPTPAEGTSAGVILGDSTIGDGSLDLTVSAGVYGAELQVDLFAAPPQDGGMGQLLGLIDDVVPLLDGVVLGDSTSAEAVGGIGLFYQHGVTLTGTPKQHLKHALRVRAVFHRISAESAWPAETIDVVTDDEVT